MGDFLYSDLKISENLDHPDSAIRLACAVHRFRVPRITRKVRFSKSFQTVGKADKTRKLMLNAEDARSQLEEALDAKKVSAERVVADAKRYQPMIHSILLSCKVQAEEARLDERLLFAWASGVEDNPKSYKSEAIMYDLVMTVVAEGLGSASAATEHSVAGDFAAASREYAKAAGVFDFLADDILPKWISKGSKVEEQDLPSECHAPFSKALSTIFQANGQQMAVATVLMKPGKPNYSLLSKLCLGIAEQLEAFTATVRRKAFNQMARLDKDFFTLVDFQVAVQKTLSLYFQARDQYDKTEYGIGIALMSEATVALRTRTSETGVGVPDIHPSSALRVLRDDLDDLRIHMSKCLKEWEKDNSAVFFQSVPQHVPAGKKLQEGYQMKKSTKYELDPCAEPVLLKLPEGALERSDSDLARELQERLNAGDLDD